MRELIATGRLVAVAAILVAAGLCQPAAAAEEGKITAFAVWQGKGETYPTEVKQGTMIGTVTGTMYVMTEQGPVLSGDMVCPLVMTFNQADSSQTGQARCTITSKDGQVFSQLSCTGFQYVGCSGDYKITGGTGRFAGITGGGKAVVRGESRSTGSDKNASGGISEEARGIIYWKDLEYKIP
jgi:hypothetical protein